jgi:hypothetical protein
LKTMFLLLLRTWQVFVLCCPVQSSERCFDGKQSPWQLRYRQPPTPHLRQHLDHHPSVFAHLPLTTPPSVLAVCLQQAVCV